MTSFELRRLSLAYHGRLVLDAIDLAARDGERLCLIGPNGAGKSSLLRCLTAIERPSSGTVVVDGVPVAEIGRTALARRVAVVPQQAVLPFAIRVDELVGLGRIPHEDPLRGPRPADRAAVDAAIERVGVVGLRHREARELSLGERQLVLLAMALAQAPRLLILDEPTVHLDVGHQVRVMELLRELNERDGVSVLAVLHDLVLAANFFPRLVLLDRGRLVADGPPARVLTAERVRDVYRVDPRFLRIDGPPLAGSLPTP